MQAKDYIFQLTKKDLKELAALTNLTVGSLIRIESDETSVKISVDENAFKVAVYGFLKNLGAVSMSSRSIEQICNTSINPAS